ncbi:MAG: hypothetical protein GX039_00075 [Clostridia bacterium]|nr:hypothetical protein [Clostridia bacterium]
MSIDLEALRRRLMEALANGISPVEVFKEMGLNPGDPAVIETLLEQAGIDWSSIFAEGQGDLAGTVDKLVEGMSPENKQQLSGLIASLIGETGSEPSLPVDLKELLENWQKP